MTPELLNHWRIIPRLCVASYAWMFYEVASWFMHLPDPTNAQAAFVSTFTAAAAAFFNFYAQTGKES